MWTSAALEQTVPDPLWKTGNGSRPPVENCVELETVPDPLWKACCSQTVGEAGGFDRVLTVRTRNLAAQARRREDFARIAQALRIEGAADALHQRQVLGREHRRHVLRLVGADAMFAGQRTTRIDA